jgi:uncharacterized membrane protein YuzA (DUF378 family)
MTPSPHANTTLSGASRPLPSPAFSALDWIAMVLMIVGALNWGLVGAFDFDLVAAIFGSMSWLSRLIYILVGLAGLYGIYLAIERGRR